MEDVHAASVKAWGDDPMAQAEKVLPQKPPPLPDLSTADPKLIERSFAARHAYSLQLVEDGYVLGSPVFLKDDEAAMLGALMGKDVDPVIKRMISSAIVKGFGPDAAQVFRELKVDDPTVILAGQLMAAGGDPSVAASMAAGQAKRDAGLVTDPTKEQKASAFTPEVTEAFAAIPNGIVRQGEILQAATAIWWNEGGEMSDAVQKALGQTKDKRGRIKGGVQTVGGFATLLPVDVNGDDVSEAIGRALGRKPAPLAGLYGAIIPRSAEAAESALWGGHVPMAGGEPLRAEWWDRGLIRLVPHGTSLYRMEFVVDGVAMSDVRDERGNVFFFDMRKLVEASRVPQ
jgi:hypothetical protein